MRKPVVIKQQPDNVVPTEVLADCIKQISDGMKKLRTGRLTDRALLLLIQNAAPTVGNKPISMKTIAAVIHGIEGLEAAYLKKRT